ncbi:MAG: Yip1 family protein [Xanthobacteraceae bacterium]
MNAASRAKSIVIDPLVAWARIEQEGDDPALLLSRYVAVLALIPAVFGFIGTSLIGTVVPGVGTLRTPVFDGLFGAIFGYVMTCGTVLLLALLIDLVAPLFGGRRDFESAFRLAAYSFTPVWLVGVFLVLPGLRFLVLLGFYGAYVLWRGLPQLMKSPERRSQIFVALIVAVAFAFTYLAAAAQRAVFGTPGL